MIAICFKVPIPAQVMQRSAFTKHICDVSGETVAHIQTHAIGKAILLQGPHAHVYLSKLQAQLAQQQQQQM